MATLNVNDAKVLNAKFAVSIAATHKLVGSWLDDSDSSDSEESSEQVSESKKPEISDLDAQQLAKQLRPVAAWAGLGAKVTGSRDNPHKVIKADANMSASMKALARTINKGKSNGQPETKPVKVNPYAVKKPEPVRAESDSEEERDSRSKKSKKSTGSFLDEYKKTKKKGKKR